MTQEPIIKFVRDVVPIATGTWILIHEELTGVVHIPLLMVAGAAIGIPGIGALAALFLGREKIPPTSGDSRPSVDSVSS